MEYLRPVRKSKFEWRIWSKAFNFKHKGPSRIKILLKAFAVAILKNSFEQFWLRGRIENFAKVLNNVKFVYVDMKLSNYLIWEKFQIFFDNNRPWNFNNY